MHATRLDWIIALALLATLSAGVAIAQDGQAGQPVDPDLEEDAAEITRELEGDTYELPVTTQEERLPPLAEFIKMMPDLKFSAGAKSPDDLARLLPAETAAYGSWVGSEAFAAAYEKSDFRKVMESPSLAKLVGEYIKAMDENAAEWRKSKKDEGRLLAGIWTMGKMAIRRPLGVAVVPTAEVPREAFDREGPLPALVVLIDVGPAADDQAKFVEEFYKPVMATVLKGIKEQARWDKQADGRIELGTVEVHGVKLHQLSYRIRVWHNVPDEIMVEPEGPELGDGPRPAEPRATFIPMKATWGVVNNVFFLSWSEEPARLVAQVAAGQAKSLADAPNYRAARAKWGDGTAMTRSYVDEPAVAKLLERSMEPGEAAQAAKAMKLTGLAGGLYGGSLRLVGKDMVTRRYLALPGGMTGLAKFFDGRGLTADEQGLVPADVLAGVAICARPGEIYAKIRELDREMNRDVPGVAELDPDAAGEPADPVGVPGELRGMSEVEDSAAELAVRAALGAFDDVGAFLVFENELNPADKWLTEMMTGGMRGDDGEANPQAPAGVQVPFDHPAEFAAKWHTVIKWKVVKGPAGRLLGATAAAAIGEKVLHCFSADLTNLPEKGRYQWEQTLIEYMRDATGGQVAWFRHGDYFIVSNTIRGVLKTLAATPEKAAIRDKAAVGYAGYLPQRMQVMGYASRRACELYPVMMNKMLDMVGLMGGGNGPKARLDVKELMANASPILVGIGGDGGGVSMVEAGSVNAGGWQGMFLPAGGAMMLSMYAAFAVEAEEAVVVEGEVEMAVPGRGPDVAPPATTRPDEREEEAVEIEEANP